MLRDTIIDRWVKELDKEIYDLLELREEVAGERLVIEDEADRQCAMAAPSDGIKIVRVPSEENNYKEMMEAAQIDIDYAAAVARLKAQKDQQMKACASVLIEKQHDEQEESQRKIFEVIREEHYFKGDEEQALGIIELLLSKSGKTIQDALDTLKDAKAILLRYHYIC